MKLGIGSYTFGWWAGSGMTPIDLLDEAEALNVDVVQVADNVPLHVLPEAELQAFTAEAIRRSIALEVGTRGITPDQLHRYLDIARMLGSPILRTVIDTRDDQPQPAEVETRLHEILPEYEAAGVIIAIENHDRFSAVVLRDLMEKLDSPSVGICLDTANSIGAHEGVGYVLDMLAPWIVNVHIKDITIQRLPHLMGFHIEGAPAGQGVLDIPKLLGAIRSNVPRDVNAILELWTPPEIDTQETIAKEKRWARESVTFLRTLIPD